MHAIRSDQLNEIASGGKKVLHLLKATKLNVDSVLN